jgi:enterochelin esterase-like enzyme
MNRKLNFGALFLCFVTLQLSFSQEKGSVLGSVKIESEILHKTVDYSVYLPYSYNSDTLKYPVIYLLHGFGGDETSWLVRCNLANLADSLIYEGVLPETIIIMPDGDNSYYINDYKSKNNYEDFFITEFIPGIESKYRIIQTKNDRTICGLSMGGFGAIILPVKHPDLFGYSISLSAAVRTPDEFASLAQVKYETNFSPIFGDSLKGKNRITEHWKNNSPYFLIDSVSAKDLCTINWFIDCGMNDQLYSSNKAFHEILLTNNIPHEYHMRVGSHNWNYWRSGFIEGMIYLGKLLKEKGHI